MKVRQFIRLLLIICVISLAVTLAPTVLAAPVNDDFNNATVISTLPFSDTVDNTTATTESGEPLYSCYPYPSRTVWYKFTPSANAVIQADMAGSSFFDTVLRVWRDTGSGLSGLNLVGCNNYGYYGGSITFSAQAGTTYYLQAGNGFSGGGNLRVNVQAIPPPANDDFANARVITALPFSDTVDTTAATRETGEPTPSCGYSPTGSVWYAFTPTSSGSISAKATASFYNNAVVGAYTGTSLTSLTPKGCQVYGNLLTFRVNAGTTYYFQVSGFGGSSGSLTFQLDIAPAPVADFYFYPYDPSIFDTIQFNSNSYDPGNVGIESWLWNFGDGSPTATDSYPTHRYATDADYTVKLTVTTFDGRTASKSKVVTVMTHDVAITSLSAPLAATGGQTRSIVVGVSSKRYPETVQVQLFKSDPSSYGGFALVGTLTQSVPVRPGGRTTNFDFSYTFTSDDASIGKVTFKAVAVIIGARDALTADNEAIAPPTKVVR